MIAYRQVGPAYFEAYEGIPMRFAVRSILKPEKIAHGLGGVIWHETPVPEYTKDLGRYNAPTRYGERFDISNWVYFMAFDGEKPVGACTVVSDTPEVWMLEGRADLSVLWDLRVAEAYRNRGIGGTLFKLSADWSRDNGFRQMKIECQNNNIAACRFYAARGAVLGAFNEYAYYNDPEIREEIQLLWYLDLGRLNSEFRI